MTFRQYLLIGAALPFAAIATPSAAQEADQNVGGDIVVTAQKRTQTLIDVPQSVSVVSAEMLEAQGATNLSDYLKNVSGLQLEQNTPGRGRLVLRGVNTGGVASTVSVYLDETPFGSSTGLADGAVLAGDVDPFDIARIEVLRGPQGTLYGASSLGGLLKFVSNPPSMAGFEAKAIGGIEMTKGGDASYRGGAMINVPLGETLAFRASGSYRKQGGYIDSVGTAGSNERKNINDFENYSARASLLWQPDSALSIRLSALLQNIRVEAAGAIEADPATLKPLYGGLTLSEYIPEFNNLDYRVYNATVEYDLGPASLTSATSYAEQLQAFRADVTANLSAALGGPYVYVRQDTPNRKWTHEMRLASNGGDVIEWLVGGYYAHEKSRVFQRLGAADPTTPGVLSPIALDPELAVYDLRVRYEEIAGFANATLHLAPWFDIDIGGRYSHNKQAALQETEGALLGDTVIGVRSSDNVFTWSVAPKVKFGSRASLYGRVAKGYRPGGPNVVPTNSPPGTPQTFDPDTVTSYEIGFKGETSDRSAAVEAALYHIDWNDIQLAAMVNGFGVNVNGGSAKVDGAEIVATLRPDAGLTTSVQFTYTDARLGSDTDPLVVGAVKGDRLPFTPKYAVSINVDYQWDIGADATASFGGSIRSLSKQSGNFDPAYLAAQGHFARIPSYEVIDLRAGLTMGNYSLNAYVNNLTNSGGIVSVQPLRGVAGLPRYANGASGIAVMRPRTIGLNLTVGF